ncbi:hypothetical protein [Schaalia odontolytica]|uniref:hypothetical protein n=1 Tax=Schaalia odontolytica TaxID=1660 RepID=UPI0028D750BB|nr:hypothetical protein [Schaalia odontolytica]
MNDDKKIQQRIRALLALAQDEGASASERERIEVRELVLRGGRSTASYATCVAIEKAADAAGLVAYYMDRSDRRGDPHILVRVAGFGSDLDWVMPLAAALASYTAAGWASWRRANSARYKRSKAPHRRRLRDGFILGFGLAVADVVRETRTTALTEASDDGAPTRALVVRSREAQVAEWAEKLSLRPGAPLTSNADTRRAGYSAGRASGLGARTTNVAGTGPQRITSH